MALKIHTIIAAACVGLAAAGVWSAGQSLSVSLEAQRGRSLPVWPPRPDVERIRYVASIATPRDVGAGPGWFGRTVNFIAGRRGQQPRLLRPQALAIDSRGRIIVTDPEQRMVHVFDPASKTYSYLEPAPFVSPVGVAVGADDEIFVTDSGRRAVLAYGRDGRKHRVLGVVNGERIFARPTGIAVSRDNHLFVVDTVPARISVLSREGRVLRTFGERGTRPGTFNYPTHIALDSAGNLLVVDSLNARVQVVTPEGEFVRAFGRRGTGTGDFDKPKGLAVDPDGHIYVAEGLHDVVQIFDAEGRLLLVVGASGSEAGQFALPSGIAIDRTGRVLVADSLNHRVQIFQYVSRADAN